MASERTRHSRRLVAMRMGQSEGSPVFGPGGDDKVGFDIRCPSINAGGPQGCGETAPKGGRRNRSVQKPLRQPLEAGREYTHIRQCDTLSRSFCKMPILFMSLVSRCCTTRATQQMAFLAISDYYLTRCTEVAARNDHERSVDGRLQGPSYP